MLRSAIFSDLHIDINGIERVKYLISKCFKDTIDIIILAGDLSNDNNTLKEFIDWLGGILIFSRLMRK